MEKLRDMINTREDLLVNWDLFVLRHQNKWNVFVHLISFVLFWLSPILALLFSPWWLLGFFSSGFVGVIGHYIFKDGTVSKKEATSSVQVVFFSSKMAMLFIQGKYQNEIKKSRYKYFEYKKGKLPSIADPEMFKELGKNI